MLSRLSRNYIKSPFKLSYCLFSTSKKYEVTPENLRNSASRMLDYYIKDQESNGGIKGLKDSCHYCKLPNALVYGGRVNEADRMLDYCVNSFLRPNGDFTNVELPSNAIYNAELKTLHWEFADFYPYLNQWWITCGVRLGRQDFIGKAMDYIDNYWYNPVTEAQVVQDPYNIGKYNQNCIFNSSHLGLSYVYMGNMDKAIRIANTICKMVNKQPNIRNGEGQDHTFYNRFDDQFNLLESFDPNEYGVRLAAIIKGDEPLQCWWSLGYPISYLGLMYLRTNNKEYLDTAELILNFLLNCNNDVRNNIVSHKVMWGSSIIANITGNEKYWNLCFDIASHIMNIGQTETGRVDNWHFEKNTAYGDAQIIDQTAEIAYWFFVVASNMEQAKLKGTL